MNLISPKQALMPLIQHPSLSLPQHDHLPTIKIINLELNIRKPASPIVVSTIQKALKSSKQPKRNKIIITD